MARSSERLAGRSGASLRFTSVSGVQSYWRDTILVFDSLMFRFGMVPGLGKGDVLFTVLDDFGTSTTIDPPFHLDPSDRQALHRIASTDLARWGKQGSTSVGERTMVHLSSRNESKVDATAYFLVPSEAVLTDLRSYAATVRKAWSLDGPETLDVLEAYCEHMYGRATREDLQSLLTGTSPEK